MPQTPSRPIIALAGGGHAHLYTLRRTAEICSRGYGVVLVNPSRYLYYSGMATGVVSRTYTPEEDRIDVRRLVERGGGRFLEGRVAKVLSDERLLLLADGTAVPYDVASFCLGSATPTDGLAPDGEPVIPVKPVENTAEIHDRILGFRGSPRILVVGGGAAGCEVAANAAQLMKNRGVEGVITLVESGRGLLEAAPEGARRRILDHLRFRGVEVLLECGIRTFEDGVAVSPDGRTIGADLLVAATGVVPPPIFRRSGLATGDDGGMWVNHHLRSISDGWLFGGGDSVCFRGSPLPRLGVFAIRQGPVLFHNLQAALRGEPLRTFEPQKRYLYVLNLGDGTGLAVYGSLVWRGRAAMILKHAIDKRFMNEHRG